MARRPPSLDRILRKQRKAFIKKFGREPGPKDPVFFDPSAPGDVPVLIDETKMKKEVLEVMAEAGLPGEVAYAYAKTGYLILEGLEQTVSAEARAEWLAAIAEYERMESESPKS